MTTSPTETLADFAVGMQHAELPQPVWGKAAVSLLDAVGLALEGGGEPTAAATRGLFLDRGRTEDTATVWCDGARLSLLDAVLVNGVCVHAHFQDDCDMTSWSHPGSLITPVAVCVAEWTGGSLEVALRGLVAGYAALTWLGADETVGRAVVSRGLRASPTLGPAAAAVAGSVALGLDASQSRSAIGIAADMSGGTLEPVRSGADDWRIQNGSAAWRGALAALLARGGVLGSLAALEGPRGFAHAFAGLPAPPQWQQPPEASSILGVWEKAFPTLGDNIAVSLAASELSRQLPDTSSVTRIVVHQNAEFASYPGTSFRGPFERRAQAMASTAFAVAVSLLRGGITMDGYDDLLDDAEVARLIGVLTVHPEPGYAYTDGMVEVTCSGRVLSAAARDLPRTLLHRDAEEARRVFGRIADGRLVPAAAESFADAILDQTPEGRSADLKGVLRRLEISGP
ncbi:MAG: MmgE/PrpD family protein [Actinomycetota bacterium]|nr:MmgE/PrpD family protein [Actinomycetota bacterium]